MKRIAILLLALLLTGCTANTAPKPSAAPESTAAPEPAATAEPGTVVTVNGQQFLAKDGRVIEPECTLDIHAMTARDFGGFFLAEYPTARETRHLDDGTETGNDVTVLRGEAEGPTVYVVGGVHGDERAGWFAGLMLKDITLKAGTLCVLAPANRNGAENLTRYVTAWEDLNRSFPGSPDGATASRVANAIFTDIQEVQPAIVLDLHEAIIVMEGRDFLGSTMIYTKLAGMEDMFLELLFETQAGNVTSEPFGYQGPAPAGSINRTVTDTLEIPCITVETFRGYPIERRVADQLAIVQYVLEYYGLR